MRVLQQMWGAFDFVIVDEAGDSATIPAHQMNRLARLMLARIGLRVLDTESIPPTEEYRI